jgi:hypothetical protein
LDIQLSFRRFELFDIRFQYFKVLFPADFLSLKEAHRTAAHTEAPSDHRTCLGENRDIAASSAMQEYHLPR